VLSLAVLLSAFAIGGFVHARPICSERIDALFAKNDILGIEAKAATCREPSTQARVAFLRGDFFVAHAHFERARAARPEIAPTVAEIQSAALAGSFDVAASLTERFGGTTHHGSRPRLGRLDCIEDAYASRAQQYPMGHLRTDPSVPHVFEPWCAALAADLVSDGEYRTVMLRQVQEGRHLNELLAIESKADTPLSNSFMWQASLDALHDPSAWLSRSNVALEDSIARRAASSDVPFYWRSPSLFIAQAALFRAVMGQKAKARAFLDLIPVPESYVVQIAAVAAFFIGDLAYTKRFLTLPNGDRVMDVPDAITLADLMHLDPSKPLRVKAELAVALEQMEGPRVAELFARDDKTHRFEGLLARTMLPASQLEPLREWLRHSFPAPNWQRGVLSVGLNLGDRLALAEAFDDTELVAMLRPRVDAFAWALTGRELELRMRDATLPNDLLERISAADEGR